MCGKVRENHLLPNSLLECDRRCLVACWLTPLLLLLLLVTHGPRGESVVQDQRGCCIANALPAQHCSRQTHRHPPVRGLAHAVAGLLSVAPGLSGHSHVGCCCLACVSTSRLWFQPLIYLALPAHVTGGLLWVRGRADAWVHETT